MQTVAREAPSEHDDPEWIIDECPVCRLLIFSDDVTAYDVWDRLIHEECRAAFLRQVAGPGVAPRRPQGLPGQTHN